MFGSEGQPDSSVSSSYSQSFIEFTTCFHEFFEYESSNFLPIILNLKIKWISYWLKNGIFLLGLSISENQNKYYIIFGRKDL